MPEQTIRQVDHSALRTNQAVIILFLVVAFILNSWPLVGVVSVVMIVGTLVGSPGFRPLYRFVLKPSGLVKPDVIPDNPEPHRFAQGLGGAFTLGSTVALLIGAMMLGWVLAWTVIVLAALNLFLGFCAGCFAYYQLNRLGVPGFDRPPVEGSA